MKKLLIPWSLFLAVVAPCGEGWWEGPPFPSRLILQFMQLRSEFAEGGFWYWILNFEDKKVSFLAFKRAQRQKELDFENFSKETVGKIMPYNSLSV